jgi:hypothetical protein
MLIYFLNMSAITNTYHVFFINVFQKNKVIIIVVCTKGAENARNLFGSDNYLSGDDLRRNFSINKIL